MPGRKVRGLFQQRGTANGQLGQSAGCRADLDVLDAFARNHQQVAIHFEADDSICAVDPPGGPFLYVGGEVAGKTIKGIRSEGERYYLVLK